MGLLDRFRKRRRDDHAEEPPDDLPWPLLSARAMDRLRAQTAVHDDTWDLASADFSLDLTEGAITFTAPSVSATAPVQVVGTLTAEGSWLWGWDHPSVPAGLDRDAARIRAYGERHGLAQLTTRMVSATEADAWEYTAVAALLADAGGAFRGPTGNTAVFLTFASPTLSGSADSADPGSARRRQTGAEAPHTPVVPAAGNDAPELIGPPEGLPTPATSPHLSGPEPDVTVDHVIDFVRGYFDEMHPTYHIQVGATIDDETGERLMAEQDAIRGRYWRRNDTFFVGGVRGSDRRYDLTATRDWTAQRIADRLWQVNWTHSNRLGTTCAGLLVMAFDDGLRVVDELHDRSC